MIMDPHLPSTKTPVMLASIYHTTGSVMGMIGTGRFSMNSHLLMGKLWDFSMGKSSNHRTKTFNVVGGLHGLASLNCFKTAVPLIIKWLLYSIAILYWGNTSVLHAGFHSLRCTSVRCPRQDLQKRRLGCRNSSEQVVGDHAIDQVSISQD